ncbi:MFS transporter [Thermodesulforhabdus norvegica]|uniref:Predicted arabinose efflux permease, MFS family n=1 Tax=Thermodesulforhabdus norvegica TaxID=39841 RepID=A0A1I4S4U2_9BACT|nr:MFS transporter [Thermodesulforhabdus norvegica]SFM59518.1 Predicted arabinose efflux permease, MFS family [Thermodesulforhabdus norvegica]
MVSLKPRHFGILLFGRALLNMSYRMVYPFLPALSRGIGVGFEELAILATLRSACGLVSPFLGFFLDKGSYRFGLFVGILIILVGALGIFLLPAYWGIISFFISTGLAKAVYDPAVQAYVSSFFPYETRARGIGIVETAWATSWFVGMPICAFVLDAWGWRGPFLVIALWGCLAAFLIHALPAERRVVVPRGYGVTVLSKPFWVLTMSFLMMFSNENLIIVYGAWMEEAFGLRLGALGVLSFIIGSGELAGEALVALIGDRLGKKRILTTGLSGLALVYLLIPYVSASIEAVVFVLWLMFFFSEVAVVSSFAFVSEVVPEAKGYILSINYACGLTGRLIGSITGPTVWHWSGNITFNALLSFSAALLAFLCLKYYSHRARSQSVKG